MRRENLVLIMQLRALFDDPPPFNDFQHRFICGIGREWTVKMRASLIDLGIPYRYIEERPGRSEKPLCGFVLASDADVMRLKAANIELPTLDRIDVWR
jgi:hypothetical protein